MEKRERLDQSEMKMRTATVSWGFIFARSMYQTPDMSAQHLQVYIAATDGTGDEFTLNEMTKVNMDGSFAFDCIGLSIADGRVCWR